MDVLMSLIFVLVSTASAEPLATPIFLKMGMTAQLEFAADPSDAVPGDRTVLAIEKLGRKLFLFPLVPEASTNLFVSGKNMTPRNFIITISDEAEPTFYRSFPAANPVVSKTKLSPPVPLKESLALKSASFSLKKDYLIIEVEIAAGSDRKIVPEWKSARLTYKSLKLAPSTLWSDRQEVQKNSRIAARFEFKKPNIPLTLNGVSLSIPTQNSARTLNFNLGAKR